MWKHDLWWDREITLGFNWKASVCFSETKSFNLITCPFSFSTRGFLSKSSSSTKFMQRQEFEPEERQKRSKTLPNVIFPIPAKISWPLPAKTQTCSTKAPNQPRFLDPCVQRQRLKLALLKRQTLKIWEETKSKRCEYGLSIRRREKQWRKSNFHRESQK